MEKDPNSKSAAQEKTVTAEGSATEEIIHFGPQSIASAVKRLLANIPYEHEIDNETPRKNYMLTAVARGEIEKGAQETTDVILYKRTIPWAFTTEAEWTRMVETIFTNIIIEKNKDAKRGCAEIVINETNPLKITLTAQ